MLTKNERSKYLKELCSSCVRTGETIWDKPRERKKKKKFNHGHVKESTIDGGKQNQNR